MALTALWWWIDRWRKSTAYTDMTLAEQGAYRNLLDEATLRGGPLPTDERVLAKACGDPTKWKRVRSKVMSHFYQAPDGWRNETLDGVLARSEELRLARVSAGRQGGLAKASNASSNASFSASKDPSKTPSKPLANDLANTLAKTYHPYPYPSPEEERTTKPSTPAAPERPPTSQLSKEPADDGNYHVILKLAHEVIETTAIADPTDGDLVEALKAACARNGIDYSAHRVIPKALEAAARTHLLIPVNGSQPRRSVATMAAELRTAKTPEEMGARLKALAEKTGRS